MKESYVFLADGFEEVEALTPVDVLRRGGVSVKTVSITSSLQVTGAHGVSVVADVIWNNSLFKDPKWLILPGGMPGASNLYEFAPLQGLLRQQFESKDGRIAAICASPAVILGQLGLLKGRKATCYPGMEDLMEGAKPVDKRVTVDDKFVLGNGPSSALPWALAILKEECGEVKSNNVANAMLLYPKNFDDLNNFFG